MPMRDKRFAYQVFFSRFFYHGIEPSVLPWRQFFITVLQGTPHLQLLACFKVYAMIPASGCANRQDDAHADIHACGFWYHRQSAFLM